MNKNDIKAVHPPNLGWLDYKLNSQEMDYIWRCIENKKENYNKLLAGNISSSYKLLDRGDWFFTHTVRPLISVYVDTFRDIGSIIPTNQQHPYHISTWWVNYQKQNEFNPHHNHKGVYSFVIWMKIPKDIGFKKQNRIKISADSNYPCVSAFSFLYPDILGSTMDYNYEVEPEDEGRMLFFPSLLGHQVYPFYDCDEERISVSGNVSLNTTKVA